MNRLTCLSIVLLLSFLGTALAADYQQMYEKGQVAELKSDIYSKPYFEQDELPRAAYYEALVKDKDFDKSLQELIEGFPEIEYKDQINFKLGVINFFQRNYSQAEFYFNKVENTSQFNEYNYWLSRLHYMKQEHNQSSRYATMFLENCTVQDHKYELSFYMLIENSISENNFQKAVVLAEELLQNKNDGLNKPYLYYRIGYSYERLNNLSLSVENYKQCFELDPYGQYAAMTEERLFELKKTTHGNFDTSFLYTRKYDKQEKSNLKTYKTDAKTITVTDRVQSDTITVLSKYFNSGDSNSSYDKSQESYLEAHWLAQQAAEQARLAANPQSSSGSAQSHLDILTSNQENRVIVTDQDHNLAKNVPSQGNRDPQSGDLFPDRPTNREAQNYIYMMNKPVGKYFIQIGRFTEKESAVRRTKDLFYFNQTWNIFRDVRGGKTTYVIWSQPYDSSVEAKKDIALFKSKNIDCFLVSNE